MVWFCWFRNQFLFVMHEPTTFFQLGFQCTCTLVHNTGLSSLSPCWVMEKKRNWWQVILIDCLLHAQDAIISSSWGYFVFFPPLFKRLHFPEIDFSCASCFFQPQIDLAATPYLLAARAPKTERYIGIYWLSYRNKQSMLRLLRHAC